LNRLLSFALIFFSLYVVRACVLCMACACVCAVHVLCIVCACVCVQCVRVCPV
jgi:hypothetical protein